MPSIEFLESDFGRTKSVDVPDGGELLDVCDEVLAPIPFSCRSASCATCQVEVLEGLELLEPAQPEERELLDLLEVGDNVRLACQARVRPVPGMVRLKPVGT